MPCWINVWILSPTDCARTPAPSPLGPLRSLPAGSSAAGAASARPLAHAPAPEVDGRSRRGGVEGAARSSSSLAALARNALNVPPAMLPLLPRLCMPPWPPLAASASRPPAPAVPTRCGLLAAGALPAVSLGLSVAAAPFPVRQGAKNECTGSSSTSTSCSSSAKASPASASSASSSPSSAGSAACSPRPCSRQRRRRLRRPGGAALPIPRQGGG
mmetsp:Transcript_59775/g.165242  ORF Transcript_59775/g.165242 Transcript_59775/m.165242 type:complete len:215 (-) Transcript_59775:858-1502(-)